MQISKRWLKAPAAAMAICSFAILATGSAAQAQAPPVFKVDPFWPKPLPNKWIMEGVPNLSVDKSDHIWVLNRPEDVKPDESGASTTPPRTDCCIPAPAVLEFDTDGNLLKSWGGPGYVAGWPHREHSIVADNEGNIWISGTDPGDGIQKFTADGKLLWDFGHRGESRIPGQKFVAPPENNQRTDVIPIGPENVNVDEVKRDLYIVGISTKNVLVYDMDTGAFKRGWGGHGMPLSEISNDPTPEYDESGPPPDQKQFAPGTHCVHFAVDGLAYVCERASDRIQVFTKDGKFVTSFFVHPSTPARGPNCGLPGNTSYGMCGTIFNLTFSHDAKEKYVLIADGTNDKVWIQDRMTGKLAGSLGDNGRMAGYFHWLDAIGVDSKGNLYTGEVDTGKRVQKFILTNGDGKSRPHPHE